MNPRSYNSLESSSNAKLWLVAGSCFVGSAFLASAYANYTTSHYVAIPRVVEATRTLGVAHSTPSAVGSRHVSAHSGPLSTLLPENQDPVPQSTTSNTQGPFLWMAAPMTALLGLWFWVRQRSQAVSLEIPQWSAAASSARDEGAPLMMAATAVLDPPKADTATEHTYVYNKGIVSPEEGVNLPFTLAELREAIPQKCFEKSLLWSMFYFCRDWAIVGLMYYLQPTFFGLGILGKVVWWNIVGFYGWCLFVVGHDCGHGTFSNYGWLNQLLGHVCHAPLCVPFNGWRISHRNHHQFHNDVDRDHSWVPSVAANVDRLSPIMKFIRFSPLILLAYPFYLLSPSHENGFSGNHFWPWNPLFRKEERVGIAMSALSVVGWLGVIAAATMKFGAWAVFQGYWIPYMIFVAWLDLVTMMQHTDKNALFFKGEAWNYLRGAMSTIDRTYRHLIDPFNLGYGRIIDHLHHNISNGHVVHHIFFTQIPHYQLMAATEAIKPVLGKHYRYDDTPILTAFKDTIENCWFVDDVDNGVVTYKGEKEYKALKKQQAVSGLA